MNIAIYPGSFYPITLGHLDIIRRAARCFDKVCVCVMVNCQKQQPMFTPERRLELIRQSVADIPNVEVENWSGLLADFVRSKDAHILVKGVRNCADWELEAQMARINGGICPGLETVLLPASAAFWPESRLFWAVRVWQCCCNAAFSCSALRAWASARPRRCSYSVQRACSAARTSSGS